MSWCPNCKTEYETGVEICSDCGSALVEALPPEESDHAVLLTTVGDLFEADRLESLLKACGIPVLRKYRGPDGYISIYMGTVLNGIDIYVPSKAYQEAKGLISQEEKDERIEEGSEGELKDEGDRVIRKRSFRASFILIAFFAPGLIAILILILRFLLYLLFK